MIKGVNHLGIAVRDLETSMNLFGKIFGIASFHQETVEEQKVAIASFKAGEVLIELTAPTSPDSPISKFLEKRGEGIHHIGFETDDITTELHRLHNAGVQLIDSEAKQGAHDMLIAFLHPKSTNSILMELCQHQHSE